MTDGHGEVLGVCYCYHRYLLLVFCNFFPAAAAAAAAGSFSKLNGPNVTNSSAFSMTLQVQFRISLLSLANQKVLFELIKCLTGLFFFSKYFFGLYMALLID